jgi:hypothetical protein
VNWLAAGSGGPYGGRMVWAAMSRRAGLGYAATALAFVLTAGTGCASPARQTPVQGHPRTRAAAAKPEPAAVSLPQLRGGLPWPVTLRTADGMFVIARDGAIRRLGPHPARRHAGHPAGFVWVNRSAGLWATMRDGHLVIMRNRLVIWNSAGRYAVQDAAHMADILAGRPGIAFQVRQFGPWFIASGRGPEHPVATAGWPEMWSRSGNLIAVLHRAGSRRFGYAVYSPTGTRLAVLATGLSTSVVDQRVDDTGAGIFWYLTAGGDLVRTDGTATRIINTRALGLTGIPEVQILRGGLIQFLSASANGRQGQVILYPDGQLYARIRAPKGQVGGFGTLSVSPDRRMVAYILTKHPGDSSTIFVFRPGGAPAAVYRTAHGGSPCALPPLAWHGSWLLYTPHGGRAALIDTAGRHRIIRLPPTLPGSNGRTLRVHAISWQ